MANRNQQYKALALRLKETPKGDRVLSLMTAEAGLLEVFVFGGGKSKLRSLASPYALGTAFVYFDPITNFYKLTDFDVQESFYPLRESLKKLWGAGLVAEVLLKTQGGGGDFETIFELVQETLISLMNKGDSDADYSLMIFLWRMLGIIGLQPDMSQCSHCESTIKTNETLYYQYQKNICVCETCAHPDQDLHILLGSLIWLRQSETQSIESSINLKLDMSSRKALKALIFNLTRHAIDSPLLALGQAQEIF